MQGTAITEKKNTFRLTYQDTELTVSGDFDSGNLNWAAVDPINNVCVSMTLSNCSCNSVRTSK